jgi:hypothetical protein
MSNWPALALASPSSAGLCREMERAARALSFASCLALVDLGLSRRDLAELTGGGDIGRARVEIGRGGLFQPIDAGLAPSIILPVVEGGELVDLLAFSPRAPDSWAMRRGAAWLLGADNIPQAGNWETGARTVQIFANPLEWLIGGGAGICVLAWTASAMRALGALGPDLTLIADSAALAGHIEQQIAAVQTLPRVIFDNSLILEAAA